MHLPFELLWRVAAGSAEGEGHSAGHSQTHDCRRLKNPYFCLRNGASFQHDLVADGQDASFFGSAQIPIIKSDDRKAEVLTGTAHQREAGNCYYILHSR
ncbi:hypothetical protein SDC9_149646 [bioreactor metagenome]|uniref:Uncharacterized protein n=1 Tax=bioreactor metagenome TaxID=1076179 RepID=A0A645EM45_9ZZZZ